MQTDIHKRRLELLKNAFESIKELLEIEEAQHAYENREYLSTTEFARLTGREPKTISNYASSGRLKAKKEGGIWMIHKTETQRFIP